MKPLVDRLSALSPAQRALLELRLKRQEPILTRQSIARRQQENYCPLSLDQERIWFIQQLDPASPAYNIYTANRFMGPLDVSLLKRSLNEIVSRHEILRTTFAAVDGKPVQIIAPSLTLDVPVVDLRALAHDKREKEAELIASNLVRGPFDLTQLPLFRSTLVRVDDEAYICATVFHHIITDWVSFHVFERELALLYEAFKHGRPSPLPQLPIQYADFAIWQRRWAENEAVSVQLDYWRRQLEDAPLLLELPRDRSRPAIQTPEGHRQPLILSKAHSDGLRLIAQQEEATLFIALLAVFKVLLFRLTGQEKLIVGSPIANRNHAETENLVGFFINQLALCTDLSGNPTFRELLRRVRDVALGAYAHQEMPFGKLVEILQPERALSHTPLTQVVFLFLNPQQQGVAKFADLNVLPYTVDGESSKFDMTFSLWDNEAGFEGFIEYNTDLFDASTIIRMTEQFRTLLGSILTDPDQRLSHLILITETARHQLVVEWASSNQELPSSEKCVHQLFEAEVDREPDRAAVMWEDKRWSYGELNRHANQLAHYLQGLNIGLETPVGILLERTPQMIVALLAVLKAGAPYLPIDPNDPPERVAFMLADAQASVLISQRHLVTGLPASDVRLVCLDTDEEGIAAESEENPDCTISNSNLAYIIYTSGSTGRPKGVAIEHCGLANLVSWHQRAYEVTPADRATLIAGQAFDASVWELWPYLTAGARVAIPAEKIRSSVTSLIEWLAEEGITLCFLPTPLAEVALEEKWPSNMPLRFLLTGGDSLHRRPPADVPFRFFNHYGPTENTVVTTATRIPVSRHGEEKDTTPPIGRPIANTEVYVLDAYLQPAPVGVTGELYIGGIGLARGYLNQPHLTAEKFVPHPFSSRPGARLYRTGDLVRYRSDGQLEFLGRADYQVKVRGFRIELGEIEAALKGQDNVRESLLLMREDVRGQKQLVAYVVAESAGMQTNQLRESLKAQLPDYMVPSAFVILESLPLTRNGKVDRRMLPSPNGPDRTGERAFVEPRSEIERQLAAIWSQVIGIEHVGIHDNFFELGGDSILSIQLIAKANRLGLRLAPKQIFQHQTIAELAGVVVGSDETVLADQGVITGEIPLTPIQHWFFEQNLPDAHHFNQSLLLELRPGLEPRALAHAVKRVFAHHDALHLRFTRDGAAWRQINAATGEQNVFTCFDLSEVNEDEQGIVLETVSAALQDSLDLSAGPLARAAVIEPGLGKSHRLLMIIHHLVVDGVSWRILLEDLQMAYEQVSGGSKQIELLAKTTSFKRWAERLTEYARSAEVETEVELWANSARQQVKSLPVDHPVGANTIAAEHSLSVSLNAAETRALLHEVPADYRAQIDDVLLTALALAFQKFTGVRQLMVDLEGHGRQEIFDDIDLSRTVGWFTAIYPVLLDLDGAETVNDAVKLVKEQLRRLPNRGLGYGLLRYMRGDDASSKRLEALPQAEVSFNYLGQLDQTLAEPSLLLSARDAPGLARSPRGERRYLLEINASIAAGQFQMSWTFSENLYDRATILVLTGEYMKALRNIIAHRAAGAASCYALSDFPLASLDQRQLDWLIATYPQVEDIYPLSHIQKGMLFHTLSAPDSGLYTEQLSCGLIGDLDLQAFEQAWQRVVDRHSILRTSFVWSEFDEPLQIVRRQIHISPDVHDLRGLTAAAQQEHLAAFMIADRERGFDPSIPPLMRLSLFRTAAETYQLVWSHHHLLLDGWSMPLVLKEVSDHYDALRGHAEPRNEPAQPFRDYIKWLQRQDQSKAELYWRQVLKGFKTPTPLGVDQVSGAASPEKDYGDEQLQLTGA
ncbi:MAG: amino acid adenylation domain-containing protein, partial [bacterium]